MPKFGLKQLYSLCALFYLTSLEIFIVIEKHKIASLLENFSKLQLIFSYLKRNIYNSRIKFNIYLPLLCYGFHKKNPQKYAINNDKIIV